MNTDFDSVLMSGRGIVGVPKTPDKLVGLDKEEEQRRTKECLADLLQLLPRDTSKTRYRLALVLEQQARLIKAECSVEHWLNTFPSGE